MLCCLVYSLYARKFPPDFDWSPMEWFLPILWVEPSQYRDAPFPWTYYFPTIMYHYWLFLHIWLITSVDILLGLPAPPTGTPPQPMSSMTNFMSLFSGIWSISKPLSPQRAPHRTPPMIKPPAIFSDTPQNLHHYYIGNITHTWRTQK